MCAVGYFENAQKKREKNVARSIEKTLQTAYTIAKQTHSEVRVVFSQNAPFTMKMELDDSIEVTDGVKKVARFERKLDELRSITSGAFLPNTTSQVLIFYHWGTRFPENPLELVFKSNNSFSLPLKSFQKEILLQAKPEEYPYAVIEKEKKDLYAH